MIVLAFRMLLGFVYGAAPSPPVVLPHAALVGAYEQCLEEHDLEPDENDGECDEHALAGKAVRS